MKPLITDISDPAKSHKWTIVHVLLGAATAATPWLFILYFYAVMYFNLGMSLNMVKRGKPVFFILTFSYLISFELIARMTKSYPFVPSEYVKYMMLALGILTLYLSPRKASQAGVAMIFLFVPALFFDFSGLREWADLVNCWFGGMSMAVCVALFGSYSPSDVVIKRILRVMWFPLVAMVVNMFIKTPELEDIQFTVKALKSTTGGASSNQASSMLGFGMFLAFYSIFNGEKFTGRRILDILFLLLFAYQGLLTFSRGGMFVGIIAMVMLVFLAPSSGGGKGKPGISRARALIFMAVGALTLAGTYMVIDKASGGKLSLRYQGETPGSAAGYAEKDLNRFTSGRSMIFEEDLMVFAEYPVLGGGAGSSPHLREFDKGVIPHIEFSRLLAEHGILGLAFFFMMLYVGWQSWKSRKTIHMGNMLFILFCVGLMTSFHSAMRTFVTPFLIALSAMSLNLGKTKRTL